VLGVHIVGDRVGELMAEAQLITNWEALPSEVAQLIHPHPTQSEAIGEATGLGRQAAARARLRSTTPRPNPRDQKDRHTMPTSVTMPALGESVTEGTVTRWLKQEGDRVETDERCSRCPPTRSTPRFPPRGGRAEPDQGRRGRDGGGRRRAGHHRRRRRRAVSPARTRHPAMVRTPRRKSPHRSASRHRVQQAPVEPEPAAAPVAQAPAPVAEAPAPVPPAPVPAAPVQAAPPPAPAPQPIQQAPDPQQPPQAPARRRQLRKRRAGAAAGRRAKLTRPSGPHDGTHPGHFRYVRASAGAAAVRLRAPR